MVVRLADILVVSWVVPMDASSVEKSAASSVFVSAKELEQLIEIKAYFISTIVL